MTKINYGLPRPKGMTKPGTKPNTAGEKLVTITNGKIKKRVGRNMAAQLVKQGWKYCPKK